MRMPSAGKRFLARGLMLLSVTLMSCSDRASTPLVVSLPSLTASKLPFAIALDQGLYAKHGLDVQLEPAPDSHRRVLHYVERAARAVGLTERQPAAIAIDGLAPMIVGVAQTAPASHQIVLGSTDCTVRAHVIARKGITSIEELKGKRIGVSSLRSTSGYQALLLAERMGWDPVKDVAIILDVEGIDRLLDGSIDAMIASENEYAAAQRAGLPILVDMQVWNEAIAGNSIKVMPAWLEQPMNRETASRFLKAAVEAIALLHQRPDIAQDVLVRWYGVDVEQAKVLYGRAAWIPRKPYPCYVGIQNTMKMYDSAEMRRHKPTDFYDDSLLREVDESGFIDALYQQDVARRSLAK